MSASSKISRFLFIIFTFCHTILPDDVDVGRAIGEKSTRDISIEALVIDIKSLKYVCPIATYGQLASQPCSCVVFGIIFLINRANSLLLNEIAEASCPLMRLHKKKVQKILLPYLNMKEQSALHVYTIS